MPLAYRDYQDIVTTTLRRFVNVAGNYVASADVSFRYENDLAVAVTKAASDGAGEVRINVPERPELSWLLQVDHIHPDYAVPCLLGSDPRKKPVEGNRVIQLFTHQEMRASLRRAGASWPYPAGQCSLFVYAGLDSVDNDIANGGSIDLDETTISILSGSVDNIVYGLGDRLLHQNRASGRFAFLDNLGPAGANVTIRIENPNASTVDRVIVAKPNCDFRIEALLDL